MADTTHATGPDGFASRSDWIRLHTLVMLRWLAVCGQLAAMAVAWRFFDIAVNVVPCVAIVGLSVVANIISGLFYPENRRLTEYEALSVLIFDSCQLAALLYLTGGLSNPFALLMLAPTTIAATALHDLSTGVVGLVTLALVTILAVAYVPLHYLDGTPILMPQILAIGFWLAIVIGVVFLSLYARRVSAELHAMSDALLATQLALAREQTLTDLSGVVAAAAHELGTPLATIMLTSAELVEDLSDRPQLKADAELIREQADRCGDILHSMGRSGKDDLQMRMAPFQAIVEEAAEPHRNRHARVLIEPQPGTGQQPMIRRRPEIIHGLRNLIQNAVDFSRSAVWIELEWTVNELKIRIIDDGPGFPPNTIGRIGDPFMGQRGRVENIAIDRRHYKGMGLGLFIAKTLLERSGATLRFGNASDPFLLEEERPAKCGAEVELVWPRALIEIHRYELVGENTLFSD